MISWVLAIMEMRSMVVKGMVQSIGGAWEEHGRSMGGAWEEHGKSMGGAWEEHGKSMVDRGM